MWKFHIRSCEHGAYFYESIIWGMVYNRFVLIMNKPEINPPFQGLNGWRGFFFYMNRGVEILEVHCFLVWTLNFIIMQYYKCRHVLFKDNQQEENIRITLLNAINFTSKKSFLANKIRLNFSNHCIIGNEFFVSSFKRKLVFISFFEP